MKKFLSDSIYNYFQVHQVCIHKIWAVGSYKRFMWILIGGEDLCFRISDKTYRFLRSKGVATAQSFRKK